ncbi:hypothetical protein KUCAC02_018998%2C partial [Xyrichtys novacula]|uniref:Uncharacterized protein n=1 Tax=Xyrichtys novacula TaxID=13765 RepID=A0AAV1GGW7_XYRNO|nr:hypothetical protein KUCAC02_018998%2C partial [Xyrichtys novacula]
MECEFQINTRSPLLSVFQKRPPETKQRVAQRRLGHDCMLHFPHSRRMVSVVVVVVVVVLMSVHPGSFRRLHRIKKGALQGETRCAPVSLPNQTPGTSFLCAKSARRSPATRSTGTARRGRGRTSLGLGFRSAPRVLPSASPPHAVQSVGATAGLEANKARRNGAPVPALQQLAVEGGAQNLERIPSQQADRILVLIMTAHVTANIKASSLIFHSTHEFSCVFWKLLYGGREPPQLQIKKECKKKEVRGSYRCKKRK